MMKKAAIHGGYRPRLFRMTALLLLLALPLSLLSCGEEEEILTEGLTVLETPTVLPSGEAIAEAEEVILPLISLAAKKRLGVAQVPPGTQKKLASYAKQAALLLAETGIPEEGYRAVTALLASGGEGAILEWYSDSPGGYPLLRALYLSLTLHLSGDTLARLAYDLLVYSYDMRCEDALSAMEENRDRPAFADVFRKKHEALAAEREALTAEIGEESFSAALRTLLMLSDLMAGTGGDGEALASFTPTEILTLCGYVPLDGIRPSTDGYALLLSLAARSPGDSPAVAFLSLAEERGELPLLAEKMPGLLALITHMRDGMDEREAALLLEGEREALLSSLFVGIPAEDWALLSSLTALLPDRAAYDEVGVATWGAAYTAYAEAIDPISAEELRAAAGGEGFAAQLARFLSGISPVLSYPLDHP